MYEIMSADEAIRLIRDGDCICVNSFVGIENPTELHEALYRRYQKMQSPTHLTIVSSAGFGVWDDEHNAEGYIREGAVDKLICGHFGAMMSTKIICRLDVFPMRSVRRRAVFRELCLRSDWIFLSIREEKARVSTGSQLMIHWLNMWKWMGMNSFIINFQRSRLP